MNREESVKNSAEKLYAAIGQIDDRFVSEAIAYRAKRTKSVRVHPALGITTAVAALLVLTVAIGLFAGRLLREAVIHIPSGNDTPVLWSAAEGYDANTALLTCLSESKTKTIGYTEAPALDDGKISIIWRDESDGTYYSVTLEALSASQERQLEALLKGTAATAVSRAGDPAPFSLWVSTGDGTAVSPYLSASSGNVSYGTPAEYAPEQLPSEALAEFLKELIESNLE